IVSEGLAALAFTGVEVNLVLFLKLVLRHSNAQAANTFATWMGTLNICTLLGAFLSDSYLGRFQTCVLFQTVLVLGLVLLSLTAQVFMLKPGGCGRTGRVCDEPSRLRAGSFYLSIYLLALGSGAVEPALASLGSDQSETEDEKTAFFSYYYVALNLGSMVAETVLVYVEGSGRWVLAFWISTGCAVSALVFLLGGVSKYRRIEPSGNPVSRFCQVFVACVRKRNLEAPSSGAELHESDPDGRQQRLPHTHDFKRLDRAAMMTPSEKTMLSLKGQTPSPWHLCTVTQVEEVKCVLRLIPIWLCIIVASVAFAQVLSLFVEQGTTMNTKIRSFEIPPASMIIFDIITISTFIICYKKILSRKRQIESPSELQRIGVGMAVSILAMIVAGLVERNRLKHADRGEETSSLSIFWQVPQYVLVGISEALINVAQWEFFTSQISDGLKSLGLGLSMSSTALGSYLCSIIVSLVMKVSSRNGKAGWIPPNLNEGHLDRFFFLSGALIACDLVLFVACAKRFKCIQVLKKDNTEK
ncbi:hypothetical protein M569_09720, partial [Genlisea aurea]